MAGTGRQMPGHRAQLGKETFIATRCELTILMRAGTWDSKTAMVTAPGPHSNNAIPCGHTP